MPLSRPARAAAYASHILKKHGPRKFLQMGVALLKENGLGGTLAILRYKLSPTPGMRQSRAGKLAVPPLSPHNVKVDIVICVHNALEDVQRCLSSLLRNTLPPYELILVDDGSEAPTRDFLARFAHEQGAQLIRNDQAKGYTRAANQGMRVSKAPWTVLLNSDTILTPYWLDRLIACAVTSTKIGIVGPLSNAASWQSIPEVEQGGNWGENELPAGVTPEIMAYTLAGTSTRAYPRVGFLNGFCLLLRTKMRRQVGLFDEETFGAGYGEENDYCLRARKKRWELVVADDTYIYHAQSKSYSHDRRKALAACADQALHAKHGTPVVMEGLQRTVENMALLGVRARTRPALERRALMAQTRARYEGMRVLFLLPAADAGGGGNVILSEAQALMEMGVNAEIVNFRVNKEKFEQNFTNRNLPVWYIDGDEELKQLTRHADALIATLFLSVPMVAACGEANPHLKLGYYVQDFEPYFFPEDHPFHRQALQSYTAYPQLTLLTKSAWNREEVLKHTGRAAAVLGPSYAWESYYPSMPKAVTGGRVRVAAMIRPSTPRRAPEFTLDVLRRLHESCGANAEIVLFGCSKDDPAFQAIAPRFPHKQMGALATGLVPGLLDSCDVFLDLSTYQAMGLTALEAMACGVAVVAPERGGAGEFIIHEENGLLVDTQNVDACITAARRLVEDAAFRQALQLQAVQTAMQYYPERAARALLDALADGVSEC